MHDCIGTVLRRFQSICCNILPADFMFIRTGHVRSFHKAILAGFALHISGKSVQCQSPVFAGIQCIDCIFRQPERRKISGSDLCFKLFIIILQRSLLPCCFLSNFHLKSNLYRRRTKLVCRFSSTPDFRNRRTCLTAVFKSFCNQKPFSVRTQSSGSCRILIVPYNLVISLFQRFCIGGIYLCFLNRIDPGCTIWRILIQNSITIFICNGILPDILIVRGHLTAGIQIRVSLAVITLLIYSSRIQVQFHFPT